MSKINIRSPYFISVTTTNITSAVLDLYIYTGTQVATIPAPTYSLDVEAYNGKVVFEISQLISDYLEVNFDGVLDSQVVWVNYRVTETISNVVGELGDVVQLVAFDGYGYFEEGVNPQLTDRLLQSNTEVYVYDANYFYLPVQQDDLDYIDLMYQGEEIGKVVTEAGQNLILYSEDVSTVWTATQLDLDLNAIVTGSYFGDRIVATNSNSPHWIEQTYTKDTSSSGYTASFYVKAAEYSRAYFRISDGVGGAIVGHFNTVTQSWTNQLQQGLFTNLQFGYTDEGSGWYRIYMTFNASTDTQMDFVVGIVDDNDDYIFVGDELNGVNLSGIYIRGMQLQEGALGNYVETTSVGVTVGAGTTYPNRISFTPTTDSGDVIRYVSYTNPSTCAGSTNYLFEDRANYLFEDSNVYVFDNTTMVDEVLITYLDASTQSVSVKTIRESKQTPYRITFINKFGALQSVWMFKRSDLTLNVESEKYRSYTMSNGSYKTSEHQYRSINVSGKESVTLNSGFYPESYNKIFKEIVLSNKVWIDYEGNLLPVNLKSKELAFKTRLNDKLINYQLEFEFAFDTINNVF
jgi:hypothetical protein